MVMFLALCHLDVLNASDLLEHLAMLVTCKKLLTKTLVKHGYWYHNLSKTFSKYFRQYFELKPDSMSDLNLSCTRDFRKKYIVS